MKSMKLFLSILLSVFVLTAISHAGYVYESREDAYRKMAERQAAEKKKRRSHLEKTCNDKKWIQHLIYGAQLYVQNSSKKISFQFNPHHDLEQLQVCLEITNDESEAKVIEQVIKDVKYRMHLWEEHRRSSPGDDCC